MIGFRKTLRAAQRTWGLVLAAMVTIAGCHRSPDLEHAQGTQPFICTAHASLTTPHVDIQRLIDAADDGGVVRVPGGRHVLSKGLVIKGRKGLTINFDDGATVVVDDVTENVITLEDCEDLTIEGGRLSHLKPLTEYDCHGNVIDIAGSSQVRIVNCDLNGCGAVGVFARNVRDLVVRGCHIHRNTFNAIYLHGCRIVRVERNVIEHNANLMQVYDVDDMQWSHNVIRDNGGYWDEMSIGDESDAG